MNDETLLVIVQAVYFGVRFTIFCNTTMSSSYPVLLVLIVVLILLGCAFVFVPKGPQQVYVHTVLDFLQSDPQHTA
jgi:hypothetical protein